MKISSIIVIGMSDILPKKRGYVTWNEVADRLFPTPGAKASAKEYGARANAVHALRLARQRRGVTQEQMAQILRVARSTYGDFESCTNADGPTWRQIRNAQAALLRITGRRAGARA